MGEKTLVTKGTLTGVLERLEARGVLERKVNPADARSQKIGLTKEGQKLFEEVFPAHLEHLGKAFQKLNATQMKSLQESLLTLENIFNNE